MNEYRSEASPSVQPLVGCIADDVTGATDLALNLVQGGMRVVQWLTLPSDDDLRTTEADALVVALKSRSIPPHDAISMSLKAWQRLREFGCQRYYFKYCSTFDSTDDGNIGPVAESLMKAVEADQTIFCPAFPQAGRTVYAGHLFVNGSLLHESGMEHHPLNPMRDPSLLRVLSRQTTMPVGLVPYPTVAAGATDITQRLNVLRQEGCALAIVDAMNEQHLRHLAAACVDMPLLTGGSGLARFLPHAYRQAGLLKSAAHVPYMPHVLGKTAILSGSCSRATRHQVTAYAPHGPTWKVDVASLMSNPDSVQQDVMQWLTQQSAKSVPLIYSTSTPEQVAELQRNYGTQSVAAKVERFLGRLAQALVHDFEVKRLVVAGGETSAAVTEALGVRGLRIGPEIAPGVPWTESLGAEPLAFAFKSGNFGGEHFFQKAVEMLA